MCVQSAGFLPLKVFKKVCQTHDKKRYNDEKAIQKVQHCGNCAGSRLSCKRKTFFCSVCEWAAVVTLF